MLASQEVTAGHRWKIVLWLVEWILAVVLLSASAGFVVARIGEVLISRTSSNLILLLAGVCAVLVGSGLASLAVKAFTAMLFPLLVVRLYRFVAGPGELRPEISAPELSSAHSSVSHCAS